MRTQLKTIAVAFITASVAANTPAIADAFARFARNADKVDGKHAVGAGASISRRKGKLVATGRGTGRLPNNIIAKAPDANRLDGRDSARFALKRTLASPGTINQSLNPVDWTKLKNVPEELRDGDAIGPSAFAHIAADGTYLWATDNMPFDGVDVPTAGEGIYCFKLPETPVHIDVTPQFTAGSELVTSDARAFASVAPGAACPDTHADAMVRFRASGAGGAIPPGAFFVSFMFAGA